MYKCSGYVHINPRIHTESNTIQLEQRIWVTKLNSIYEKFDVYSRIIIMDFK